MKVTPEKKYFDADTYTDLSPGKTYYVIGIQECEYFWILNDEGRAFLYEIEMFEVLDSWIPDDWEIDWLDGELYGICPRELNTDLFFEKYYEGKLKDREEASMQLKEYIRKMEKMDSDRV